MITLLKLSPYTGDVAVPSPNHDARREPAIEGIVLHATADEGEEDLSLTWLCSPRSQASCHLLVGRSGEVTRLVGDRQRAWHAGVSWWRGTSDVNSITLGIEIANRNDGEPYTEAQYHRVAEIVAHYCGQGLSLDDVVSHEAIAEGRKTDPCDWDWDTFRTMVEDRLWLQDAPPPEASVRPEVETPPVPAMPAVVHDSAPTQTLPVPASPDSKHVLQSRTVWLNTFTMLGAGGLLAGDAFDLADRLGIHPPDDLIKWALFTVGMVNIILRLHTTQAVSCRLTGECSRSDDLIASGKDLDDEPNPHLPRTLREWSTSGGSRR